MFHENEHEVLDIASIVFNSLSFCSSLWVFYLYIRSPSPCNAQFKMLVNLTLSDFLISITGFLTHFSPKNDRTCTTFVFLSLVSYWSSAFWSSIVAIFSYKKIATSSDFNSNKFYNRSVLLWIVLCVILPMMPIFGLFGSRYISNGEYCAIAFTSNPVLVFLASEGLPIYIALLVTAISYIKQVQALKNLPDFILSRINISTGKLFWYPLAQCLVFVPGLVCQLVYLLTPCNSIIFNAIRLYGFRLAGFVNSIVYGLQRVRLRKSQDCWSGKRTESLLTSARGESDMEYEDDINEIKEDVEENLCH